TSLERAHVSSTRSHSWARRFHTWPRRCLVSLVAITTWLPPDHAWPRRFHTRPPRSHVRSSWSHTTTPDGDEPHNTNRRTAFFPRFAIEAARAAANRARGGARPRARRSPPARARSCSANRCAGRPDLHVRLVVRDEAHRADQCSQSSTTR